MDKNCLQCRKVGEKLFLKGERCLGPKCSVIRRTYAPGQAGQRGRTRRSEFGLQLLEKQKAKSEYGIRERQFRSYVGRALRSRGATGEELIRHLERRLDNVIYRLGWATSREQARQLISHCHFKINDHLVNVPSYQVRPKDKIEPLKTEVIKKIASEKHIETVPIWLKTDKKTLKAEVLGIPKREQIDTPINEQLIVEYYSK